MINIIDPTYRTTPFHSVITRLGDCWGDCCSSGATSVDIKRKRCGHRMDLTKDDIRKTFIDILDSEKAYLTGVTMAEKNNQTELMTIQTILKVNSTNNTRMKQ
jgi:hypothetical protein